MNFDNLKLGLSNNSLHDLHDFKYFVELNTFMKINVLQPLSPFKIERFINIVCFEIDLNIFPIWKITYLLYTKQLPSEFNFY